MKNWSLKITLKSDFCTATGETIPGITNVKTALEHGIPYIPARRIKGCLLEAAREMAENGVIDRSMPDRLFGRPGTESGEGIRVSAAHLYSVPEYLLNYDKSGEIPIEDYKEFQKSLRLNKIDSLLLEDIFTRMRTQTAMEEENRTAENHSLRTIQIVPEGIVFISRIEGDLDSREEKVLNFCVKGLRHLGLGITRGLGEVSCVLMAEEPLRSKLPNPAGSLLNDYDDEEEVILSYKIHLDEPVVIGEEAGGTVSQLPGSAILGALAGMYIKKYNLGQNAHEEEEFRRIFLQDGVQFGGAFLNKRGVRYVTCPRALTALKDDRNVWINSMSDKSNLRRKSLHGQIFFDGNKLYTAEPKKEIHFHHARPIDRGIGHALNDLAEDTSIPTGQFFQYLCLSKGQNFSGTWRGKAKDIKKLLQCLEENHYRIFLGKSRTAEYGSCTFSVEQVKRFCTSGDSRPKARDWFLWTVTPLVCIENGEYAAKVHPFIRQLEEKLHCSVKVLEQIAAWMLLNGYNSKWRLPSVPCPALASGSTFHIRTEKETAACEIENDRWGVMTGKGCGEVRVLPYEEISGGKLLMEEETPEGTEEMPEGTEETPEGTEEMTEEKIGAVALHNRKILKEIAEYQEKQKEFEAIQKEVLKNPDLNKQKLPPSSAISMLIAALKEQKVNREFYSALEQEINHVGNEEKKKCMKEFIEPCREKPYEYMRIYLENAKWRARYREEENE